MHYLISPPLAGSIASTRPVEMFEADLLKSQDRLLFLAQPRANSYQIDLCCRIRDIDCLAPIRVSQGMSRTLTSYTGATRCLSASSFRSASVLPFRSITQACPSLRPTGLEVRAPSRKCLSQQRRLYSQPVKVDDDRYQAAYLESLMTKAGELSLRCKLFASLHSDLYLIYKT
jgi:hypothetical protein